MKKTFLATALVGLMLSSAAVFAEGGSAPACAPGRGIVESQAALKTMTDNKVVEGVTVFDTVAKADAFLADYNKTYNKTIPLGHADHLIVFKLLGGDNAGLWLFGYKDGCQIGLSHIPKAKMNPEVKLEVPRAFLDHGSWMLVI